MANRRLRAPQAFKFDKPGDIDTYEHLLKAGFAAISEELQKLDQIFVDTKFGPFRYRTPPRSRPLAHSMRCLCATCPATCAAA